MSYEQTNYTNIISCSKYLMHKILYSSMQQKQKFGNLKNSRESRKKPHFLSVFHQKLTDTNSCQDKTEYKVS